MSPEQLVSSKDVDERADVWGLGVVLYELLAGRPPFVAETVAQLCVRVMQQPPPPLDEARPGLPEGLEAVVLKCLEKDREDRYPNVALFARALAPFAGHRAATLIERITAAADEPPPSRVGERSTERTDRSGSSNTSVAWGEVRQKDRGRRGALLVVTASILLLAGLLWTTLPGGGSTEASAYAMERIRSAAAAIQGVPAAGAESPVEATAPEPQAAAPSDATPSPTERPATPEPPPRAEIPLPAEVASGTPPEPVAAAAPLVPAERPIAPRAVPTAAPTAAPSPFPYQPAPRRRAPAPSAVTEQDIYGVRK
jgi:eukaryotic-like serine/threonine-protein kinase